MMFPTYWGAFNRGRLRAVILRNVGLTVMLIGKLTIAAILIIAVLA